MKLITLMVVLLLLTTGMGIQAAEITNNGQSAYRIVVPVRASITVKYAAKELQNYLKKITGVKLPVSSEKGFGDGPAFLIGPCKKTINAGLMDEASKLREDGVLIRSIGKDIALLGQNERGNLYSVYILLEKFIGVRFLAWDCTVIPKHSDLTLPELNYSYAPPFMYRETLYWDSFPKDKAPRQRLNGPFSKCDASVGGKVEIYPYVHSFNSLVPPDKYYKDHPEYYGLQGGKRVSGAVHAQLCLTNPDVLKIATAQVMKWIEEHPEIPIIDVSQNDGIGPCECDKCMAIVNEEGTQHGPIIRFVNAIADEVAKKYPDKWIETLAYAYSMKPSAITKPHKNVIIRLCHAGCYYHGFEQCGLGANLQLYIDEWSKQTNRIFIWHYATNFAHYLAPNPNLEGLAKDIKYYASHNVNGLMVQCDYQSPGGELAELREYLSAQLMWNPKQDPMQIRKEFCQGYYEKASDTVLEFLEYMDQVGRDPNTHAFGAWDPQEKITPEFVDNSLKILKRAKESANNGVVRNRIDKLMLPFWYMKLTYPEKYNLSDKDAPVIWQQTRQTLVKNHITHVREGGDSVPGWIASMDARFAPVPKDTVFDLLKTDKAKVVNCADWRINNVKKGGQTLTTIFQHPNGENDGDATYSITLPSLPKGKRIVMRFGTVITNKTEDGVRFAVLVNGNEVWNETKTTFLLPESADAKSATDSIMPSQNPFSDNTIDISTYAGQTVTLTLRVNAIGNGANDWANWVEPRVVLAK